MLSVEAEGIMSHLFPGDFQGKYTAAAWKALVFSPKPPRSLDRGETHAENTGEGDRMPPPHRKLAGADGPREGRRHASTQAEALSLPPASGVAREGPDPLFWELVPGASFEFQLSAEERVSSS